MDAALVDLHQALKAVTAAIEHTGVVGVRWTVVLEWVGVAASRLASGWARGTVGGLCLGLVMAWPRPGPPG